MCRLFPLLFLISSIAGCSNINNPPKKPGFNAFDFSYNDVFSTCFSIKFTSSDTVYIRQYFARHNGDIKSNTNYYGLLSNEQKNTLDSFLINTDFKNFDTLYYQHYEDGVDFQYYFEYGSLKKRIRAHSNNTPVALISLKNWILNIKDKLTLYPIDTLMPFKSAVNFLQPQVKSPVLKFKPPKIDN